MHQLFVYGTLRKGGISHYLLEGAPLLAEGVCLEGYALYNAGWYPLAVVDSASRILGDVVQVPASLWSALDAYEGEGYERVYLEEVGVWLYRFLGQPDEKTRIPGGDWLSWWSENRYEL